MPASLVFGFLRVQATEQCRRKSKTLGGCRGLFPVVVAESSLVVRGACWYKCSYLYSLQAGNDLKSTDYGDLSSLSTAPITAPSLLAVLRTPERTIARIGETRGGASFSVFAG
jgi:hypothetical protein